MEDFLIDCAGWLLAVTVYLVGTTALGLVIAFYGSMP